MKPYEVEKLKDLREMYLVPKDIPAGPHAHVVDAPIPMTSIKEVSGRYIGIDMSVIENSCAYFRGKEAVQITLTGEEEVIPPLSEVTLTLFSGREIRITAAEWSVQMLTELYISCREYLRLCKLEQEEE